jgi:hypothetical protein
MAEQPSELPDVVIGPDDLVLLLMELAHYDDARRRRNMDREALFEVEAAPTEDREGDLWRAMTGSRDSRTFDPESARYRRVCIVAPEAGPAREWVSFFRRSMPSLVAAGKLYVCTPPFERSRATVVPLEQGPVS